MDKKERNRLIGVFFGVLVLAFFKDLTGGDLRKDNTIFRNEYGEEEKEVSLELAIEGEDDTQHYVIVVEPKRLTREQAEHYFDMAKKEISNTVYADEEVTIKETYAENCIIAEWKFSPYGYIDSKGTIFWDKIPKEGILLNVSVLLTSGIYEEIYQFPLFIKGKEVSEKEQIIQSIDEILEIQMQQEGEDTIQLPEEARGRDIVWKEEQDYLTGKVFFLEVIALMLLYALKKREQESERKKKKEVYEYEYPDMVNQLGVLLGAGMTTRQAWIRMAKQYQEKKNLEVFEENPLYEVIVQMAHRLADGETEREAYEKFSEEIDVPVYRRLMRSLIVNLEKGTAGICAYLDNEEKQAYEIRILNAKKLGEEASTKMLVPLILQMLLVMAVVLAPAMMGFMK